MTSRQRVLMALNHQEPDRVPMDDAPWSSTIEHWRKEGLTGEISPAEYFDYDLVGFGADTTPRFPVKVVEENEEYIVTTTYFGSLIRNRKDYSSTPEYIDYPCKKREDWERIKERFIPSRKRVDWEGEWLGACSGASTAVRREKSIRQSNRLQWRTGLKGCRKARQDGKFIVYRARVGYDRMAEYVGPERLLMAIATEPDWVRDMYETDATLVIQMYEIMKEGGFEFDGVFFHCDLGYRNGLLFSPGHFEEQLRPTFQRLFDHIRGEGMPVFLHSDGNINELIPWFIEDGLTCLHPLEVKAGMNLIELKRDFGDRLTFMGGIDARAMAHPDPSVIENEIKTKIPLAKEGGGYIYHSDHSVPKNVSLAQYQRVIELVHKYGVY